VTGRRGGHPHNDADLIIAATALEHGRVLAEILDPAIVPPSAGLREPAEAATPVPNPSGYSAEDDAAIQQRLADLGYL
jgi:hypothetical protein